MANFEERLTALSSAEIVKKAKNLLKQQALAGAWRGKNGELAVKNARMEIEASDYAGDSLQL
jgi:hypothetical protein